MKKSITLILGIIAVLMLLEALGTSAVFAMSGDEPKQTNTTQKNQRKETFDKEEKEGKAQAENKHLEKMRDEMTTMLNHLEREISDLQSRADKISDQTRTEWKNSLAKLSERRSEIAKELSSATGKVKEKSRDFWSRSKNAISELKQGVDRAGKKLKSDEKEK